jgi:hypothetical protein
VIRAEIAPKLSTHPQVIWSCQSHTRATSLPNSTIITDSFLWAQICQNLDPRFRVVEDCSHSKHQCSRPALLLGNTDLKFNKFTTTALATLQSGQVSHHPGLFSLVYLKSRTHCFPLRDVTASSPLPAENREFVSKSPAGSEQVSLLTCTVRGFPVGAVS